MSVQCRLFLIDSTPSIREPFVLLQSYYWLVILLLYLGLTTIAHSFACVIRYSRVAIKFGTYSPTEWSMTLVIAYFPVPFRKNNFNKYLQNMWHCNQLYFKVSGNYHLPENRSFFLGGFLIKCQNIVMASTPLKSFDKKIMNILSVCICEHTHSEQA